MIWYLGITAVLLGYIVRYWRRGITHAIPITLAFWVLMLPVRYFLYRALDMPFLLSASEYDIDIGGMYLFAFLAATMFFHYFLNRAHVPVPLVETVPRIAFWVPAVGLIVVILALFIGVNGFGALHNSLQIRAFASTGFVAYLEIIMEFCMLTALIQLSEMHSKVPLTLFLVAFVGYFFLMARTGLLVVLLTYSLAYLCMVKRVVPTLLLFGTAAILAPVSLLQGILRQRGGYSLATLQWVIQNMDPARGGRFVAASFGSRVSQLDTFAVLARRLREGTVATDPLDPIYVFAQAIPRFLWPDKPRMFSDLATDYIAPRVHLSGTVLNFIGPAELMYAFGIVSGILISALICGYLFAMSDRYYLFCRGRPYAFLFFCLMPFTYLGSATQSGFFNSIALILVLFYGVLLAVLFRFRIHRDLKSS